MMDGWMGGWVDGWIDGWMDGNKVISSASNKMFYGYILNLTSQQEWDQVVGYQFKVSRPISTITFKV